MGHIDSATTSQKFARIVIGLLQLVYSGSVDASKDVLLLPPLRFVTNEDAMAELIQFRKPVSCVPFSTHGRLAVVLYTSSDRELTDDLTWRMVGPQDIVEARWSDRDVEILSADELAQFFREYDFPVSSIAVNRVAGTEEGTVRYRLIFDRGSASEVDKASWK